MILDNGGRLVLWTFLMLYIVIRFMDWLPKKKNCKAFWEALPIKKRRLAEGLQQLNFEYRWCQIECFHANRLFLITFRWEGEHKRKPSFSRYISLQHICRLILGANLYLTSNCFKWIWILLNYHKEIFWE